MLACDVWLQRVYQFQDARDGGFFFTFNLWQDWRELHFLARQF
jgi:hypothetical protein